MEELNEIRLEIDILRKCKHPNVVKYFGTYLLKGKLWVRSYCDPYYCVLILVKDRHGVVRSRLCAGHVQGCGKNSDRLFCFSPIAELRKPLKEDQILYVLYESLKGLAYMHEMGIIHRDIKAGNILLNAAGEVKLGAYLAAMQPRPNAF